MLGKGHHQVDGHADLLYDAEAVDDAPGGGIVVIRLMRCESVLNFAVVGRLPHSVVCPPLEPMKWRGEVSIERQPGG